MGTGALITGLQSVFPEGTKVYTALLSQSGVNDPVVTTLGLNTLGQVPTITRISEGTYIIVVTGGLFAETKTMFSGKSRIAQYFSGAVLNEYFLNYGQGDSNQLYINTENRGNLADGVLDGWSTWIEIIVYPT